MTQLNQSTQVWTCLSKNIMSNNPRISKWQIPHRMRVMTLLAKMRWIKPRPITKMTIQNPKMKAILIIIININGRGIHMTSTWRLMIDHQWSFMLKHVKTMTKYHLLSSEVCRRRLAESLTCQLFRKGIEVHIEMIIIFHLFLGNPSDTIFQPNEFFFKDMDLTVVKYLPIA